MEPCLPTARAADGIEPETGDSRSRHPHFDRTQTRSGSVIRPVAQLRGRMIGRPGRARLIPNRAESLDPIRKLLSNAGAWRKVLGVLARIQGGRSKLSDCRLLKR